MDINGAELFRTNLQLIDRVLAGVCRRSGLRGADAEDFASIARLALMENDYEILRAYEGRSSLSTFLTVVAQRLMLREWRRVHGKWHPSSEALRLGDVAVLLEQLLFREGRSIEESLALVQSVDPSLDADAVRTLAARLPQRTPRAQFVELTDDHRLVALERADAGANAADARAICRRATRAVRRALESFRPEDRTLIRCRFGEELSVAEVARRLDVSQRPLYRRIEILLGRLRKELEREGIDVTAVRELIGEAGGDWLDFGLVGQADAARFSVSVECSRPNREISSTTVPTMIWQRSSRSTGEVTRVGPTNVPFLLPRSDTRMTSRDTNSLAHE